MKRALCTAAICLLFGAVDRTAAQAIEREPGYLDVAAVEQWFEAEPTLEVNISGTLIRLVAEASRFEDPELARVLQRLKAIQVRGFSMDREDDSVVRDRARAMGRALVADGWETVVRLRERGEQVEMYLKSENDSIAGLVVIKVGSDGEYDDQEAVFVNIVGDIDPEQIGRLGRTFNFGSTGPDW